MTEQPLLDSGGIRSVNYRRLKLLVAGLGLLIVFGSFFQVGSWEKSAERVRFDYLSTASYAVFHSRVQSFFSEIQSMGKFFSNSKQVTRDEFRGFAAPILKRFPDTHAIMWVPKVSHEQRQQIELADWEVGLGGGQIFERVPDNVQEHKNAIQRDVYFPVTYIEPYDQELENISYDLGSLPKMRRLLDRAEQENNTVFGYLSDLSSFQPPQVEGVLIQPVKILAAGDKARASKMGIDEGFIIARFDLLATLKASSREIEVVGIEAHFYDDSRPVGERLIFSTNDNSVLDANIAFARDSKLENFFTSQSVDILGPQWRIVFSPSREYVNVSFTWLPWVVSLLCLVVTVWVVMMLGSWERRSDVMRLMLQKGVDDLELSRKQHGAIVALAAEAIITIDKEGLITTFNRAAEGIFGYDADEVIGKNVSVLLPENERDEHHGYTKNSQLYAPRVIKRARDLEGLRKDGSLFPLELNIAPLDDEAGGGFVGVLRDITSRKRTEQEMLSQKEQLTDILENTDDAYLQIDWKWRVTYANPRVKDLLEVDIEEILGTDLRDTMPDVVSMFYKALRTTLVKREHTQVVVFYGPARKFLEANATPTNDGLIVYFRDITERRQAELEMIRAKELAEKESQAKTAYLSRMSHELRTPMNAVLGFSQLLEMDDQLNESQKENVREVMTAGKHLLNLIDDVLDISRIEAGKYNFNFTEITIARVAEESVALLKEMARKYGVHLVNKISPEDESRVYADSGAMKQIQINMLSNAIKYNKEGGTATISSKKVDDGRVRIFVTDTGPGIDAAFHEILFDPFERLGREGEVEGTGIGLSVVKGLVEGMGGSIGLESQLGKGSTFWVEFDLVQPD